MNADASRFNKKVVLVTGSSSGTGAAIARAFARSGARVALNCRSDLAGAERLAAEITAEGHEAMAFKANLADSSRTRQLAVELVTSFGAVDILVNAAGPFIGTPLLHLKDAEWDAVMAANLRAPFQLVQELGPAMIRKGWGRIVNLGATSGLVRSHSVYGLAKAALIHLTESLALELAPAVTVNAVIPSQIASARTDTLVDYKRAAIAGTPLGRLVTEEEIANVVVRICGPEFDFMTGRSIVLDGGRALPRFPKLELDE
jgi:NAD(P)-dependent dehydrogenase (short-subunit alcohol dehydrogenase family)